MMVVRRRLKADPPVSSWKYLTKGGEWSTFIEEAHRCPVDEADRFVLTLSSFDNRWDFHAVDPADIRPS